MNFTKRILLEHSIKYLFIFLIAGLLWEPTHQSLINATESGKLESIAVVMGIIGLASITGYFSFSYTTVSKDFSQRVFGYLCTFFFGIALILSLIILYFISVIWIPEMDFIWMTLLLTLYLGTFILDNLDLLRMGMDVAATSFFEKGITGSANNDIVSTTTKFLKEGQRLEFANALIGKAIMEIGREKEDKALAQGGKWIVDNSMLSQHQIDKKIAQLFSSYNKKSKKIAEINKELSKGQSQNIADSLIANLLELVD